jgi:hypothetical protein
LAAPPSVPGRAAFCGRGPTSSVSAREGEGGDIHALLAGPLAPILRGSAAADEGVSLIRRAFSRLVGASSLKTRALTPGMRALPGMLRALPGMMRASPPIMRAWHLIRRASPLPLGPCHW